MGPFHRSGRRREVLLGDGKSRKDLIQILESCPSVGREEEE